MKKRLCGFLAVVLLLTMVLSMTGCGEEKSVAGTWEGTIDMTEALNNELTKADPEMGKYLKVEDFEITLRLTFGEDGSFKMEADEDSCETAFKNLRKPFEKGIREYLEETMKASGLGNMTLDEVLESAGLNLNDMIDDVMEQMDTSELAESMKQEGKYTLDGDKLYTYEDDMDKDVYLVIELNGDTMKITESHGDDEVGDVMEDILPFTMRKVG